MSTSEPEDVDTPELRTRSKTFGRFMAETRRGKGMSRESLAMRAQISTVYVGLLEQGRRLPSPSVLGAICGAMELNALETSALHQNFVVAHLENSGLEDATGLLMSVEANLDPREVQMLNRIVEFEGATLMDLVAEGTRNLIHSRISDPTWLDSLRQFEMAKAVRVVDLEIEGLARTSEDGK